jgi:hypothetical protein
MSAARVLSAKASNAVVLGVRSRASTIEHPLEVCAFVVTHVFDVTSQMYPSTHSSLDTHSVKQARSAWAQM